MKWPRRRRDEPDLTRAWRDIDYAVVDLETTGLDLHRDSIASYGVVLVEGGRILPRDTYGLVRPSSPMTPEAITVHALLPADVADAPPVSHAVQVIESALADRVLVAHAAWVERSFLTRAFAATGRRLRCRIIDTAAMARAAHMRCARGPGEPALERLAEELRLPVLSPHHALGDARTTAQVFLALASRLDTLGYRRARDFVDLTAGDDVLTH